MIRAIAVLALAAAPALAAPALTTTGTPNVPPPDPKCIKAYDAVGLPHQNSDDKDEQQIVLCRKGYAVSFNMETRNPDWAIEHLTRTSLKKTVTRKDAFKPDPDLEKAQAGLSSQLWDYSGQKTYQRGHQAPSEDFTSGREAMNESFYLSNMSPQLGTLNGGLWSRIEGEVRQWVICRKADELYVMTGPIYGGSKTKLAAPDQNDTVKSNGQPHRVLVPEWYYKIVYDPQANQSLAFIVPNNETAVGKDMKSFIKTIKDVEDSTGLSFLTGLGSRLQHQQEGVKGTLWGHDSC